MGTNNSTEHINNAMNNEVAESAPITTASEISKKVNVDDKTAYIEANAFIANPYSLLGRVIEVRKKDGICPQTLKDVDANIEFSPLPINGVQVDPASRIKEPILRNQIIVDQKLCASVSFLSYLNGQLEANSFFSLMVFDQATGLIDVQDPGWANGLRQWKIDNDQIINDPDVCFVYAIIGMVQKQIVRKKYTKFSSGAKGGAYGLNVNGELATSTEEYSLDIIFGLTPAIMKRPDNSLNYRSLLALNPNTKDLEYFASASGSVIYNANKIRP
jgi:hypothetical protein